MDTACQDGASFQKKNDKMLKARALYLPARGIFIDFLPCHQTMKEDENRIKNIPVSSIRFISIKDRYLIGRG